MWAEYWRVAKPDAAIVLTAQTPFDKILGASCIKFLKYEWIWQKSNASGHLNANKMPMKEHENVIVFYKNMPVYNPQKEIKSSKNIRPEKQAATNSTNYGEFDPNAKRTDDTSVAFPRSVLKINNSPTGPDRGLHPTQKPIALFEYMIKTYTNENEIILDNTAGSGTTAIAAMNTNRKWVCMEKDKDYYDKAIERIQNHGWK